MLIPVSKIEPNPLQPRGKHKAADTAELAGSMAQVGLVQPITVAKKGTRYVLIAGHGRLAAAKKLKWTEIEANVVSVTDPKLDIGRIMAENIARTDLTGKEQAHGYQSMIDLGWSDEDIKATTGASGIEVGAARAVSRAKKEQLEKAPDQASLVELAGLMEFADDPDVLANLEREVGSDNFPHRLSYFRKQRELKIKTDDGIALIAAAGIPYIPRNEVYNSGALDLEDYRFKPKIKPEDHTACPGHCATVDHQGEVKFLCSKPKEHGISASGQAPKTAEDKAKDKLKRQTRPFWRASAPIRQEFIVAKLGLKKLPPALFAWAVSWADHHGLDSFGAYRSTASDYTKSTNSMVRVTAVAVMTAEKALDDWVKFQGGLGDSGSQGDLVAYLKMLSEMGYPLSDHEKAHVEGKPFDPTAVAA